MTIRWLADRVGRDRPWRPLSTGTGAGALRRRRCGAFVRLYLLCSKSTGPVFEILAGKIFWPWPAKGRIAHYPIRFTPVDQPGRKTEKYFGKFGRKNILENLAGKIFWKIWPEKYSGKFGRSDFLEKKSARKIRWKIQPGRYFGKNVKNIFLKSKNIIFVVKAVCCL